MRLPGFVILPDDIRMENENNAVVPGLEAVTGRTELLYGTDAMRSIMTVRVILFGIGGVGAWCAESLVRSGVMHLTIVDADNVDVSNLNRQLPATVDVIGDSKVDVMCRRLRSINPYADVVGIKTFYDASTADRFDFNDYDYVIDAIDSLTPKTLLIKLATSSKARLYSSMGAALKSDPSAVSVAEFWKVKGCPLARALRDRFKRSGDKPRRKFKCVYSPELLQNRGTTTDTCGYKVRINGTVCHVTAIFGFTLAGLVINDIVNGS